MTPQRRLAGVLRRLRIPWVREIMDEALRHPVPGTDYRTPWVSPNALTKWNPSCTCSTCKRPRYSRKRKHVDGGEA